MRQLSFSPDHSQGTQCLIPGQCNGDELSLTEEYVFLQMIDFSGPVSLSVVIIICKNPQIITDTSPCLSEV